MTSCSVLHLIGQAGGHVVDVRGDEGVAQVQVLLRDLGRVLVSEPTGGVLLLGQRGQNQTLQVPGGVAGLGAVWETHQRVSTADIL